MDVMNRPGPIRDPDGWNVETLRQTLLAANASMERYLDAKFSDNEKLLNERDLSQKEAVRAAFLAQQLAMATALTAAKQAVDTALSSAKEATTKSEENAERRFESFRIESGAQIRAVAEKLDEQKSLVDLRIGELTKRLDLNQGQGAGMDKNIQSGRQSWGQSISTGALIISVVAFLAHIFFG